MSGAGGTVEAQTVGSIRYNRPVPNKIMARRVFPSEMGFERNLYRYPDQNPTKAAWLETKVFQRIDDLAAPVLQKLNADLPSQLMSEERPAWSVFVRALFYRTPAPPRPFERWSSRQRVTGGKLPPRSAINMNE